jgi:hypothetical protein
MVERDETTLLPEWRQAVEDFLSAGFNQGDLVTHAWLEQRFGMPALADNKPMLPADWSKRQFAWLRNVEAFRAELLERHQIYLSTVIGQGYRIVPPGEQTSIAQDKYERDARKSYRKTATVLKNVRVTELTESERKENIDAIARLAMLRGMHRTAVE